MIYSVYFDNISIYGESQDLTLISPTVNTEINAAGSFEFTLPPEHSFYDIPELLVSDIEVYEDGTLIWFGRPIEISIDFYRQKKVYCEGALAYFNDTIQRPVEYDDVSIRTFFETLIVNHNNQVSQSRRFTIGNVTIPDKRVYRKLDYETTLDAINKMCLETEGGYIFTRRANGVNYIDWLSEMPYASDQPVSFALNILDLNQNFDGSSIKTAVIPLGDEVDGVQTTIVDVNHGVDYIESIAAATYGRITQVVEFSGLTSPSDLLIAGENWLSDQQFDPLSIEVDASELHYINNSYTSFRVGQMIHCASTPHLIDRDFPLVKISLSLNTAVKKITIGSVSKKQFTEIYKK